MMDEAEFAELQEGEAVRTQDGTGIIRYFMEYTASVELENGESYVYKMEDLARV